MHLDRLMSVLEAVALAGRPVSAANVVEATGLPRPTCYRLIQSLSDQRLLDEVDPGRYVCNITSLRSGRYQLRHVLTLVRSDAPVDPIHQFPDMREL